MPADGLAERGGRVDQLAQQRSRGRDRLEERPRPGRQPCGRQSAEQAERSPAQARAPLGRGQRVQTLEHGQGARQPPDRPVRAEQPFRVEGQAVDGAVRAAQELDGARVEAGDEPVPADARIPQVHVHVEPKLDPAVLDAQRLLLDGVAPWLAAAETPLRYGENPHQRAVLASPRAPSGLAAFEQIQGKELSYNNLMDADGAWRLVHDLPSSGVVIVKHGGPCGAALGTSAGTAYVQARACDPVSAFGGVIASSLPLDEAAATHITELFAAPCFAD